MEVGADINFSDFQTRPNSDTDLKGIGSREEEEAEAKEEEEEVVEEWQRGPDTESEIDNIDENTH